MYVKHIKIPIIPPSYIDLYEKLLSELQNRTLEEFEDIYCYQNREFLMCIQYVGKPNTFLIVLVIDTRTGDYKILDVCKQESDLKQFADKWSIEDYTLCYRYNNYKDIKLEVE